MHLTLGEKPSKQNKLAPMMATSCHKKLKHFISSDKIKGRGMVTWKINFVASAVTPTVAIWSVTLAHSSHLKCQPNHSSLLPLWRRRRSPYSVFLSQPFTFKACHKLTESYGQHSDPHCKSQKLSLIRSRPVITRTGWIRMCMIKKPDCCTRMAQMESKAYKHKELTPKAALYHNKPVCRCKDGDRNLT